VRRLLESIADRITGFVAQRDDVAMVITTAAANGPAFLQVLSPIAESSEAGLFYTYDQPFRDPPSYVDTIADAFRTWHGGYRAVMDQEGMTPWPDLPPVIAESGVPPVIRMRELMTFSRSLLPQPDFQVVVWTFLPTEIADPTAYAQFFRDVLAHEWPRPWCHHMRVMIRDDPLTPTLRTALQKAPRIRWYEPPLGQEAYQKGFADAVNDVTLPMSERMTALLITATTDNSYGRYDQALAKYLALIEYHTPRKEKVPLAAAWNGVGEVRVKTGDLNGAGTAFEIAMVHATDGPSPQPAVIFTIAWNLARLRMDEKRFAEAADYFGVAQQCAACMRAADLKLMAIEWHGVARAANGEGEKAVELWEAGITVAHGLNQPNPKATMLERLRQHCKADPGRVRALERRLAETEPVSA
jgi:hypothetical protein